MTRALVLGGAGFIGVAACKELMRRGVETIAAGRKDRPYGTFTSYVAFDRTDEDQLDRRLSRPSRPGRTRRGLCAPPWRATRCAGLPRRQAMVRDRPVAPDRFSVDGRPPAGGFWPGRPHPEDRRVHPARGGRRTRAGAVGNI
ncbi:MAG: NAD-dependent epimerase/dehydratase family protein [Chloroflexi bacterium]|nr:MAG: NAD-dependent epimerase/dehydratase family protein [Chloroflexota bacterium]